MTVTMPLMFGFFAMQMPAGLSIYFIVSNLVGMGIQWFTNRLLKDDGVWVGVDYAIGPEDNVYYIKVGQGW